MPRNERFTADYQFRIQNLLQTLTPNIVQKQREMPAETKMANQSLAMFVKVPNHKPPYGIMQHTLKTSFIGRFFYEK